MEVPVVRSWEWTDLSAAFALTSSVFVLVNLAIFLVFMVLALPPSAPSGPLMSNSALPKPTEHVRETPKLRSGCARNRGEADDASMRG